jgi:hypothetical protein
MTQLFEREKLLSAQPFVYELRLRSLEVLRLARRHQVRRRLSMGGAESSFRNFDVRIVS